MSFQTETNFDDMPWLTAHEEALRKAAFERCITNALEVLLRKNERGEEQLDQDEESIKLALELALEKFAGWQLKTTEVEAELRRILESAARRSENRSAN